MSLKEEDSQQLAYNAIGFIKSPFKQKFAIPRQPNLVPEAVGELHLYKDYSDSHSFRAIEGFSHLWIVFHFHETAQQGWSPTVQPPRLGGKEKVGVFASRSPFRPNPIGLSVVANLGVEAGSDGTVLKVGGIDILDGTPVLDIKPYVPYADSLPEARAGFAQERPGRALPVVFAASAQESLKELAGLYPALKELITSLLQQDPRPAWRTHSEDDKQYGMTLYDLNIKWQHRDQQIEILSIDRETNAD